VRLCESPRLHHSGTGLWIHLHTHDLLVSGYYLVPYLQEKLERQVRLLSGQCDFVNLLAFTTQEPVYEYIRILLKGFHLLDGIGERRAERAPACVVPGVWTVGAMIAWISDWTGKIRVDITLLHNSNGIVDHVPDRRDRRDVGLIGPRCAQQIYHLLGRIQPGKGHITIRISVGMAGHVALFGISGVDNHVGDPHAGAQFGLEDR
jgi:hypothetical protein